jgi:hypothetical protein
MVNIDHKIREVINHIKLAEAQNAHLQNRDIKTDGTDKFKGGIIIGVNDGTKKVFVPGATNDVITMNGSTKGGIVGSVVSFTAIDTATYLVHNSLLIGSGTIVTPYADA